MSDTAPRPSGPSKGAILKATGIALAVALVLLFTAVLPAEYGIDPLHTGRLLGLTGISRAAEPAPAAGRATPAVTGIYRSEPATYKTDSEDLALTPGEGVEIKYHMQKGAAMLYSWNVVSM